MLIWTLTSVYLKCLLTLVSAQWTIINTQWTILQVLTKIHPKIKKSVNIYSPYINLSDFISFVENKKRSDSPLKHLIKQHLTHLAANWNLDTLAQWHKFRGSRNDSEMHRMSKHGLFHTESEARLSRASTWADETKKWRQK